MRDRFSLQIGLRRTGLINFLARPFEAVSPEQLFAARSNNRSNEKEREHGNVLCRAHQKS